MSASVAFPQVRRVTHLGSSPTRPTEHPQAKRSDLGKRVFWGCFACGGRLTGGGDGRASGT